MAVVAFEEAMRRLRSGASVKVVLLQGDDPGLVRERGRQLIAEITANEPLGIVELEKEVLRDAGLVAAECATPPMVAPRKAVLLRNASDSFVPALQLALAQNGPGLAIVEAAGLTAKSKLRALLEATPQAFVISCHQDRGATLNGAIANLLQGLGVSVDRNAVEWIGEHIGGDRAMLHRSCEKLAAFAGAGARISVEDARLCLGDDGDAEAADAVSAAFSGEVTQLDTSLNATFAEGGNAVQILRSAIWYSQRLLTVATDQEAGSGFAAAVAVLRPPLYGQQRAPFEEAGRRWDTSSLRRVGVELLRAERRAKSTGYSESVAARQILGMIARRAASRR